MYYDIAPLLREGYAFNFVIGGRGIGKTYSTIKYALENIPYHIYMRRTQRMIDICCNKISNPYKAINRIEGTQYYILPGEIPTVVQDVTEKQKEVKGYAVAFSTFGNFRGASFEEVELTIFDEFQPNPQGRDYPLKNEMDMFFDFYETVNRNRELSGQMPMQMVMLSNSTSITSPILMGMGLVPIIEGMIRNGQKKYSDKNRSLKIVLLGDLDVTEQKKNTVLYRNADQTYKDHALHNKFVYDNFANVGKLNINEYRPWISISVRKLTAYIYKHKSQSMLYISSIRCDCQNINVDNNMAYFRRYVSQSLMEYNIAGVIFYESYLLKSFISQIMGWL